MRETPVKLLNWELHDKIIPPSYAFAADMSISWTNASARSKAVIGICYCALEKPESGSPKIGLEFDPGNFGHKLTKKELRLLTVASAILAHKELLEDKAR